jgi:hypothetical protein
MRPALCGVLRTYEEPISFIAQADKASSVKPKEIKVKLRQDPTDPNSDEVSKTFTEFVGTDKMKDMLVDMHSPAYHHLMARANYDIDALLFGNHAIFTESWIDRRII